jgi:arylsulfatase A-like enzyme
MQSTVDPRRAGVLASARAGLLAGCVTGLVFGLVDGVWAACTTRAELGLGAVLGCLAGAVLQYTLLAGTALALVGVLLHVALRRRNLPGRYLVLLALGLGAGIAAELYWRTREHLFYGYSAVGPERLAVAAGCLLAGLALGYVLARALVRQPRGFQTALSVVVCLAWLVGGLYLAAQSSGGAERGAPNERNRDLPNVLLVVVDALRQDVLGCYGNTRVRTPHLDRLAAGGVAFENAFVQAPYTWTSFGSFLTGKYPRRHGLIKMKPGVGMQPQATLPWHLKHARRTDGRALAADDYVTASFHTGTLYDESGLLRGFDFVFEETAGHELQDLARPWSRYRSELLLWIFKNRIGKRFDSGLLAREAARWLDAVRGRRFFAMVHLYSTHTPYDPPAEYAKLYCDPAYDGPVKAFHAASRYAIESGVYAPTPADVEQIRNLYYGGVTQADALVGELLATLERNGTLDETLVIVTADHGESLGEDGLWEHNHMVRRELRVPLLMTLPGKLPAGKRVSALVDSIDVLPTVCALAELDLPPQTDEFTRIDGQSLLPLVRGEVDKLRDWSFAENGVRVSIQDLARKLDVSRDVVVQDDLAAARARLALELREPKLAARYVVYPDAKALDEPDTYRARAAEADELLRVLYEWSRSMPIVASLVVPSGRDEEELMRDTGYAGGVGDDGEGGTPRAPAPPPKGPAGDEGEGPR